jgi:hypothetical protein
VSFLISSNRAMPSTGINHLIPIGIIINACGLY